ncbi:hypothetical protein GCM10023215_44750 [Pseudonocardia yuanmonensis]|uniref:Uncharacterized protein n=1 Tax=Pseudonocardia yuanmonensis TaxID=1095914 RepID=A0ABP8X8Z9_9PSEU
MGEEVLAEAGGAVDVTGADGLELRGREGLGEVEQARNAGSGAGEFGYPVGDVPSPVDSPDTVP